MVQELVAIIVALVVRTAVDIFRRISAIWASVAAGQMMAFRASARRQVRRQSAGAGAWLGAGVEAGAGVSGFGGGKIGHLGRCVLDQEREKEVGGDPGSGEPGSLAGNRSRRRIDFNRLKANSICQRTR